LNNRKSVLEEHLAFLSVKHGVYISELFKAIVTARNSGEAVCEELKIKYRGSVSGEAIILITKEDKVVMQFRATEELLLRKNIDFENWMDTDLIRKQIARQSPAIGEPHRIQDLRHGMKKVNVEAEVVEISKPVLLRTQYGNNVMLTNAWITDQSAKIKLCLWNTQGDTIKVGDEVEIKNGSVTTFKGERQLRLGKKGTINVMQIDSSTVKREFIQTSNSILFA
jgi:hypothetical protein